LLGRWDRPSTVTRKLAGVFCFVPFSGGANLGNTMLVYAEYFC
jgi:hypothetical protein